MTHQLFNSTGIDYQGRMTPRAQVAVALALFLAAECDKDTYVTMSIVDFLEYGGAEVDLGKPGAFPKAAVGFNRLLGKVLEPSLRKGAFLISRSDEKEGTIQFGVTANKNAKGSGRRTDGSDRWPFEFFVDFNSTYLAEVQEASKSVEAA